MEIDELEARLKKIVPAPMRTQIKIDFDAVKGNFSLSAPIYREAKVPSEVEEYVIARQGMEFRPYQTSYHLIEDGVELQQKIPFHRDLMRRHLLQFWHLANRCHRMLSEIAEEN